MIEPWIVNLFPDAKVTPVTEGWSGDRKYKLETEAGYFLLRVSPANYYLWKQGEFAQITRLNQQSDAFPKTVDHGLSPDGKDCFVRYEWIEGTEALKVIPELTDDQQFQHGIEAGKLLSMIHDLPQTERVDSYAQISEKMAVRKQQMKDLQLEFDGYDRMLEFLDENLHLLRNSPTTFRHGDFHLGNMLIDPKGELKVIDFNRSDFGDPIDDFGKIFTFSRKDSVPFARGQLEGYPNKCEETFFAHALCHVLQVCAFGLIWAQQFGDKEIAVQHALIDQIMDDFDGLNAVRPKWVR